MCVLRQYTCTCVNCVSCGIYMYVCVSEYVHDWQIYSSNVNEISIAIFIQNHTILKGILMKHTRTLLIVTTSFHLCELEGIIPTFPSGPKNSIIR